MRLDGIDADQLTTLHGELIALDGIGQNTGHLSACYRVTQQGLREFRRHHAVEAADEQLEPVGKPRSRPASSDTVWSARCVTRGTRSASPRDNWVSRPKW